MGERLGVSGWSAVLGTWVTILGAFGGGFAALTTYGEEVAKQQDARVVQTFQLFEMFNSSERLAARARLFEYTKNGAALDANDLYVLLDFFDALEVCVQRDLCDRDLAVRLFQSYAVPFWDSLEGVILASRTESDPRFGAGLQWMASLPLQDAGFDATPALETPAPTLQSEPAAPAEAPVAVDAPQAAPVPAPEPPASVDSPLSDAIEP